MQPIRIGVVSAAHVHAPSYAFCASKLDQVEYVGVWDDQEARGLDFASRFGGVYYPELNDLFEACDAVVITAENTRHAPLAQRAASAGKHILCEKPLATTLADAQAIIQAAVDANVTLMTAFPCPFSPAFIKALDSIERGDIGAIRALSTTNRGTCPFGWFIDPALGGGGAMIDHVVHVADLLRRILKAGPIKVQANVGRNMYGEPWEDSAMLHLDFPGGVFATLDGSWSRPAVYKTWGDVTLTVVGDNGVIELDLFHQEFDCYAPGSATHRTVGYGSNLDLAMLAEFANSILEDRDPLVTGEDGLEALRVALSGYKSVREDGEAVTAVV